MGRRDRFGFNKVTAVSTTGFAAGASEYARQSGIELREVKSLDLAHFEDWLQISEISQTKKIHDLKHASIYFRATENEDLSLAAQQMIKQATGNDPLLVSSVTKERATVIQVFLGAVQSDPTAFEGVSTAHPKKVKFVGHYADDDHFYIETKLGNAQVDSIEFTGELRIEETKIPVARTVEYRHVETGEVISQLAAFAPQSIEGKNFAIELHRMGEDGETHVIMRRVPDN